MDKTPTPFNAYLPRALRIDPLLRVYLAEYHISAVRVGHQFSDLESAAIESRSEHYDECAGCRCRKNVCHWLCQCFSIESDRALDLSKCAENTGIASATQRYWTVLGLLLLFGRNQWPMSFNLGFEIVQALPVFSISINHVDDRCPRSAIFSLMRLRGHGTHATKGTGKASGTQNQISISVTRLIYPKIIPTGLPAQPFPLTIKRHQTGHIVGIASREVW